MGKKPKQVKDLKRSYAILKKYDAHPKSKKHFMDDKLRLCVNGKIEGRLRCYLCEGQDFIPTGPFRFKCMHCKCEVDVDNLICS